MCGQGKKKFLYRRGNFLLPTTCFEYLQNKNQHRRWLVMISQGKKKKYFSASWGNIKSKIYLWKARRTIWAKALMFEDIWSISFFKIPTAFSLYLYTHNQIGLNCVYQTCAFPPLKFRSKADGTWASASVNAMVNSQALIHGNSLPNVLTINYSIDYSKTMADYCVVGNIFQFTIF